MNWLMFLLSYALGPSDRKWLWAIVHLADNQQTVYYGRVRGRPGDGVQAEAFQDDGSFRQMAFGPTSIFKIEYVEEQEARDQFVLARIDRGIWRGFHDIVIGPVSSNLCRECGHDARWHELAKEEHERDAREREIVDHVERSAERQPGEEMHVWFLNVHTLAVVKTRALSNKGTHVASSNWEELSDERLERLNGNLKNMGALFVRTPPGRFICDLERRKRDDIPF